MARIVVTGASGFVGRALAIKLHEAGHHVVACSRSVCQELVSRGIEYCAIDIRSSARELGALVANSDAIFHVAAKVDMWGAFEDFFEINVQGTRNLLQACRNKGVRRFVYTSSPSVIADGTNLQGVDESYPYPRKYEAFYPQTKAIAEQEVLAANDEQLFTCALRPHLIFGPGDTNLIPTILERAKARRLKQVGPGKNLTDLCFIEDCVAAHICAFEALENNPDARGKAYFISQAEPVQMWDWIRDVLRRSSLPDKLPQVPATVAYAVALACEGFVRLLPGEREPLFTRFLVHQMSTDHYFDISRARALLGFHPAYSMAQAMQKTFQ